MTSKSRDNVPFIMPDCSIGATEVGTRIVKDYEGYISAEMILAEQITIDLQ